MKIESDKPHLVWEQLNFVLMNRWIMRNQGRHLENLYPQIKAFSFRWLSCKLSARCYGHSFTRQPGRWTNMALSRYRIRFQCVITGQIDCAVILLIKPCKCTVDWATRDTNHLSIFIDIIAGIVLPKGPRKSKREG